MKKEQQTLVMKRHFVLNGKSVLFTTDGRVLVPVSGRSAVMEEAHVGPLIVGCTTTILYLERLHYTS